MPTMRFPALALPSAVAGLAFILISCAQGRIVAVKERIHHDDFEYRVTEFEVADSLRSGATIKKAAGYFCIVTFEVENRAKRVEHAWDNSIGYIVDDQGRRFENLPELQTFLNTFQPFNYSLRHVTSAGATETTRLVFDLPRDCTRPYLMVRGELLMGDIFDGKAFTKTKIKLF